LRSGRLTTTSVSNPRRRRRSPEVRPTAFAARPPDLPPRSLMALDFAITCSLVRPGRPRYPVLVHRAAALLHASFRPHLAMTPLHFANPSRPSGWIEDFHLQAVVHARHTSKRPRERRGQFHLPKWPSCLRPLQPKRTDYRINRSGHWKEKSPGCFLSFARGSLHGRRPLGPGESAA
jgi:hypothetical protein